MSDQCPVDVYMLIFRLRRALIGGAVPDEVASVIREAQTVIDWHREQTRKAEQ